MAERTIMLTGDLEAFVDAQIKSGAFATAEDVVRAGFAALKVGTAVVAAEEECWSMSGELLTIEKLKAGIAEGLADLEAGRVHVYTKPGELAADIIRRGRRRSQARKRAAEAKSSS